MRIAYTSEQERLRRELRRYFGQLMTDEVRTAIADSAEGDHGGGDAYRAVVRRLGADGWLALGWPEEYGGRGGTMLDQLIFTDEAALARVPVPFLTVNSVGPTIMRFGTPAQKSFYLPKIAAGEVHFSIGYSEPGAGTDLASLRTTATLVRGEGEAGGEEYVIDGQKMWTSLIQYADYVWLACRTDPEAPRHKGLSIIIVPTSAPGFSWTPVRTMAGVVTSATYYREVRVPLTALVGTENQGWPLITNQLNHERVTLAAHATMANRALAEVQQWARDTELSGGKRVIDLPWVRQRLARTHTRLDAVKLLNWQMVDALQRNALTPQDASAVKVYGSEARRDAYSWLMEVVGAAGPLKEGSAGSVLQGNLERGYRSAVIFTFGGGNNEIQREIISWIGLGMPRVRR